MTWMAGFRWRFDLFTIQFDAIKRFPGIGIGMQMLLWRCNSPKLKQSHSKNSCVWLHANGCTHCHYTLAPGFVNLRMILVCVMFVNKLVFLWLTRVNQSLFIMDDSNYLCLLLQWVDAYSEVLKYWYRNNSRRSFELSYAFDGHSTFSFTLRRWEKQNRESSLRASLSSIFV